MRHPVSWGWVALTLCAGLLCGLSGPGAGQAAAASRPGHDFDLRWDGSSLFGSHLLNPAELAAVAESSLTAAVQAEGDNHVWELHYVKREEGGLTGGILVGGLENTWAYGMAAGLGDHLAAGVSVQRTGWEKGSFAYGANAGLLLRAGAWSAGWAGQLPLRGAVTKESEFVLALRGPAFGLSAGSPLGEGEHSAWAGVRLGPLAGVTVAHTADLGRGWVVGQQTTSLKVGEDKYLLLTRRVAGTREEYAVAAGITF